MKSKINKNLKVGILVYEGLCFFEFGIAMEVFTLPRPEFKHWYDYEIISTTGKEITTTAGIKIAVSGTLDALKSVDLVIVPGWQGVDVPVSDDVKEALWHVIKRGGKIASICSGVFALGSAGLLTGKKVTTHWRYAKHLKDKYPDAQVDEDVLYIDQGDILTSAGSAAGLDLCLYIVRQDYGSEMANVVARRLVLPAHRDGGQAQFIPRPVPKKRGGNIAPLMDQMRKRISEEWNISKMAEEAGLSERTLLRRFKESSGESPHEWLVQERLEQAKGLLENTALSVSEVAETSGFVSTELLRHHFRRNLKISPLQYRALYR